MTNFTVIDGGLSKAKNIVNPIVERSRQTSLKVARELRYGPEIIEGIEKAKTPQEMQSWLATGRKRQI